MRKTISISGAKILLTGGAGFLGSFVHKELLRQGADPAQIIIPRAKEHDLRKQSNCRRLTRKVDIVIHLAGNVGGIGKNRKLPGTLFYDNAIMGIQLMEAARTSGVKKFVCLGTICAYPKFTPVPFTEDTLWSGYPEETNAAYGLAKKMLLVQAQAYRQQYGFNSIYLLPVNLYGPGDNFDPESSHVIPALIRKIIEAKQSNQTSVTVWGDGTPTREFLYVKDAARGIVLATRFYNKSHPVNLGSGKEISIKELATLLARMLDFDGRILFDTKEPNGQPRRLLDITRARKEFQFQARTPFAKGVQETIRWYSANRNRLELIYEQ